MSILYVAALLRAVATGMVAVVVGIYLAKRGFDPAEIGAVVTAGLAGGALAALLVTLYGDGFGRRRTLVTVALLAAVGGVARDACSTGLSPWLRRRSPGC